MIWKKSFYPKKWTSDAIVWWFILFQDLKVNLIITDYCMPGMTGYELLKTIKESSTLKEIPVVIVSSENFPTRIERCIEGGALEYIVKPLQVSDVKRLKCYIKLPEGTMGT
ncbi:hypothetical protein AMTRI_Chr08g168180 [Amborella trichopoda]